MTTRMMNLTNRTPLPSLFRLFEALCRLPPTTTGLTLPTQGGGGIDSSQQSIILNQGGIGNSSGVCAVIVSPPGRDSAQASEQHKGVVCALFNKEIYVDDIPSQHISPLTQEPPIVGVYFNVPNRHRDTTDQVFERSQLYRWIATSGNLRSRQNVSHPINQQFVPRPSAWNLVRPVTANLQALLY